MNIYTIGFTGKPARQFFGLLQSADAKFLIDIRISNAFQLAGFTKRDHIEYFTEMLTHLTYVEEPLLAPSPELFKRYRGDRDWDAYEPEYLDLLEQRAVVDEIDRSRFESGAVLLCTERTSERCHRRLAVEYLRREMFPEAEIVHL